MNPIELLYRRGVTVDWVDGQLKLRIRKGALTIEEIQTLHENKPLVGGWLLLQRLWTAGYSLHLERRSAGDGYFILPRGQGNPDVDMEALFALYDTYHDSAVDLLLDACRLLKIAPEQWHIKAHEIVLNDLTPDNPPKPTDDGDKPKPICRCGSSDYVDHPIHDGQSLRRDCARCGRFIGFPVWYGVQRPVAGLDRDKT
ncbi:MAG: hypothetical protein WBH86_05905 [Thermogutta sp.]